MILILGIMLLSGITPVFAAQEYLGAYFDGTVTITDEVIFMVRLLNTDYTDVSAISPWMSVLSVAGGDGTTVEDVMYQNVFTLYYNDDWDFQPQTIKGTTQEDIDDVNIGDSGTYAAYGRTIYDTVNNEIEYYAYVYDTSSDFGNDRPTVYHYTQARENNDIENFLVGDETLGTWPITYHMRYCQVGMETRHMTASAKDLEQKIWDFGYLDSSTWKYMAAKTAQGDDAWITKGATYYRVGGSVYERGNKVYSSTNVVEFEVDGTTCNDNVSVWSGSGNVIKEALYPFDNP